MPTPLNGLFASSASPFYRALIAANRNISGTSWDRLANHAKSAGFHLHRVVPIPEFNLTAIDMEHLATKARYIHIDKPNDPTCVFTIAFRTLPSDSTGLPHILEHTVLCGSQRYPVRDPFFKMLNRSLASYMNAWTAPDLTAYPFSTTNPQDYRNLRDVYFDAVFHPRLSQQDFNQEGWRLEHENPRDCTSPLVFKGVVYNEMKGALSDVESLFLTRFHQNLLPNTTYSHVSGGDPPYITNLSHQQLLAFHHQFYHPNNTLFYSYGPIDLEENCQYLSNRLAQFPSNRLTPANVTNNLLDEIQSFRKIEMTCPTDSTGNFDRGGKIITSFITSDHTQTDLNFALQILSLLLLDGQSAPLHKALLTSGIGQDFAPGTGFDASMIKCSFSIGVQGVLNSNLDTIPKLILDLLNDLAEHPDEAFSQERVDSHLHSIELSRRDRSASFGLNLMQSISHTWGHWADPIEQLKLNSKISRLQDSIQQAGGAPSFFKSLLVNHILTNPRNLVFIMRPDHNYNHQLIAEEKQRLDKTVKNLTPEQTQSIFEQNLSMIAHQENNDRKSIELLPCLDLTQVSPKIKPTEYQQQSFSDTIQYFVRDTHSTNGLTYFKAILPLSFSHPTPSIGMGNVNFKAPLYLLPLLTDAVTELGVPHKTIEEFERDWRMNTGGLDASVFQGRSSIEPNLNLYLSTFALHSNVPKMFSLFEETLCNPNFSDLERIKSILQSQASSAINSIASSGAGYAATFASAALGSPYHLARECLYGIRQVRYLTDLAQSMDNSSNDGDSNCSNGSNNESLQQLAKKLENLWKIIRTQMSPEKCRIALLTDSDSYHLLDSKAQYTLVDKFIRNSSYPKDNSCLYSQTKNERAIRNDDPAINSFIKMPFSTNYTAHIIDTKFGKSTEISANLKVAAKLMRAGYLHCEIREKNGAYGAGAGFSSLTGLFQFYSHRDPRPVASLRTFEKALEWLQRTEITDQELLEAKLSIFGQLDAPVDMAAEGLEYFKYEITDEERQTFRDALFRVTSASVKQTVGDYLFAALASQHRRCIIGDNTDSILNREDNTDWTVYNNLHEINL